MRITVTHDDGAEQDITTLVTHAYDSLWELTNWHKDFCARDVAGFAALAEAIRHRTADVAWEIAVEIHGQERANAAAQEAWYRERGVSTGLWRS